jgi:cytochrome c oxidase subunit 4
MMRTSASTLLRRSVACQRANTVRYASSAAQVISNPTLANIEKRWEGMPLQEQADLWMALRDRMKGSWTELTVQEQKAGACFLPLANPIAGIFGGGVLVRQPSLGTRSLIELDNGPELKSKPVN